MLRSFLTLSVAVTLAGCATTIQYTSDYQRSGSKNSHGEVSANLTRFQEPGFLKANVRTEFEVFIDDELVLKSPFSDDYKGELYFLYHGEPVSIDCVQPALFIPSPECSVQINGKRSGVLTFEMQK